MFYLTADKKIHSQKKEYQELYSKNKEEWFDEILKFDLPEFDKKLVRDDLGTIYVLGVTEKYQNWGLLPCSFLIVNRQIGENANPF